MGKITKKSNIASYSKPKIIAEISGNHAGRKLRFLKLIKEAFKNGADLVKIQTYEPKDITLKKKQKILLFPLVYGKIKVCGIYIEKRVLRLTGIKMPSK